MGLSVSSGVVIDPKHCLKALFESRPQNSAPEKSAQIVKLVQAFLLIEGL